MAIIYDKSTDSVDFPIDKSLILESKDAYHVPFTFGDDWTHIRLGVLMDVVNSDNNNFSSTGIEDIGGFEIPTSSTWFGLNKNLNPLKLPTESGSGGFVGYKADRLQRDGLSSNKNGYGNTDEGIGTGARQRFIVTSGNVETIALKMSDGTSTRLEMGDGQYQYEGGFSIAKYPSYIDNENAYCVANVLEIKIINKGTPLEKVQIRNNTKYNREQTYGDIETLKTIMGEGGDFDTNMEWYEADLGTDRWADQTDYYPDSFLFYNSAPATNSIRPRIHCWAVQKLA